MGTEYLLGELSTPTEGGNKTVSLIAYEMSTLFEVLCTVPKEKICYDTPQEVSISIWDKISALDLLNVGINFINAAYCNLHFDSELQELSVALRKAHKRLNLGA